MRRLVSNLTFSPVAFLFIELQCKKHEPDKLIILKVKRIYIIGSKAGKKENYNTDVIQRSTSAQNASVKIAEDAMLQTFLSPKMW